MKQLTKNFLTSMALVALMFFATDTFAQSANKVKASAKTTFAKKSDMPKHDEAKIAEYVAQKKAFLKNNPSPTKAEKTAFLKKHYYTRFNTSAK